MKKLFSIIALLLVLIGITGCGKTVELEEPTNITMSESGLISWDEVKYADSYIVRIGDKSYSVPVNSFQVKGITGKFLCSVIAVSDKYGSSVVSDTMEFQITDSTVDPGIKPQPPKADIKIGISGASEVKSGKSISLKANVTGTENTEVTWEITKGSEFASISEKGKLKAKEVDGDKVIEVRCISKEDNKAFASKIITIVAVPTLTQAMLDQVTMDKVSFEGFVNITLYTIGLFEKPVQTYTTVVKTAMDGTNWYAEYENNGTGLTTGIYYQNHEGFASEVGVSLMNDEEYFPMLDENGNEITWKQAGLYNNFKGLKVTDFEFNEKTWRYEYKGTDKTLKDRMIASANPYDFVAKNFGLIIEGKQIMGIYAISEDDYTISEGYKAVQELNVAINYGNTVDVPQIGKYNHDNIHDELATAINNMRALNSYTVDFKEITGSAMAPGYVQKGFTETITDTERYYKPYEVLIDKLGNESHKYLENQAYGYHKIDDNLYNSYVQNNDGTYEAARAFLDDFSLTKPSFAFAPEIFREYYVDEEKGTTTYFVDELMCKVASTLYYGVGNDINIYGIFAARGYTSPTDSFTPHVVVKDGYIVSATFYFYLGSMYGVVELKYDDFNTAVMPEDANVKFEPRQMPSSWSELDIQVSQGTHDNDDDYTENALTFFKEFYQDENIGDRLPFFANAVGDSFGFGLTTIHIPGGTKTPVKSVVLYYDVPLDIDYTIDSQLRKVGKYLESLGFVKNEFDEYIKDDIAIAPTNSSLDLLIYVWKA